MERLRALMIEFPIDDTVGILLRPSAFIDADAAIVRFVHSRSCRCQYQMLKSPIQAERHLGYLLNVRSCTDISILDTSHVYPCHPIRFCPR